MSSREDVPRDEELMRQVAEGSAEALALLHRRFARLIFGLAVQTLDRAAAEDLVQDVLLAAWRNAGRFDPARGTVRSWVLQIAHFRLLNELRRRGHLEYELNHKRITSRTIASQAGRRRFDPGRPLS